MTPEILQKIKDSLLTERKLILDEIKPEEIDSHGDESDIIQGNLILSICNSLSSRKKEKILLIEDALVRISNGEFGTCTECEEEIPSKRLEISPYVQTCVFCAERLERLARRK
jgi:DnaK suppressor protein